MGENVRDILGDMDISEEEFVRKVEILLDKISELMKVNAEELAAYQYAILTLVAASSIKEGISKELYMTIMTRILREATSSTYDVAKIILEKEE